MLLVLPDAWTLAGIRTPTGAVLLMFVTAMLHVHNNRGKVELCASSVLVLAPERLNVPHTPLPLLDSISIKIFRAHDR